MKTIDFNPPLRSALLKNVGLGVLATACTLHPRPITLMISLQETAFQKQKKTGDRIASGLSYDGATPTKKSIVVSAAEAAPSVNAASCEGAVRWAAVPPARNFRN